MGDGGKLRWWTAVGIKRIRTACASQRLCNHRMIDDAAVGAGRELQPGPGRRAAAGRVTTSVCQLRQSPEVRFVRRIVMSAQPPAQIRRA